MADNLPVSPAFTQSEIATHTSAEDAWVVIHGKVYDVSSFLDEHPGGRDVLLESAGKDATADYDFAGHSDDATDMLRRFEIGALSGWIKHAPSLRGASALQAVVMPRGITSARVSKIIIARALSTIAVAGLAVAYAQWALERMVNLLPQGMSGFWLGFMICLGMVSVAAIFAIWRLQKAVFQEVKKPFEYPPYYHFSLKL